MWVTVRNVLLTVVLLVAAAATTWMLFRPEAPAATGAAQRDAPPAGYYLRGARLLGTDAEGRIAYEIYADRAEELPDEEALRLEQVRVDYRPADGQAWVISASRAFAPIDGSALSLEGNVELRSEPDDGSQPTVITTDHIDFRPEESLAVTTARIEVRVDSGRLSAVGLRAHLKDDRLELESDIHGQILP
jgi:lipopolysaccharide export system protein LptC